MINKKIIKKRFDDKWVEKFIKNHEKDMVVKKNRFGGNSNKVFHICPVLRILILRSFLYELIYEVCNEDKKKLKNIREILLKNVLINNQNIIRAMKKNNVNDRHIFPDYFESISVEDKEECMKNADEYTNDEILNEYDIRPHYVRIINILNSTSLHRDNFFNRLIEHCEYGIYLGFLMKLETDKIDKKILIPNEEEKSKLGEIQEKFEFGMEVRFKKLREYFKNESVNNRTP